MAANDNNAARVFCLSVFGVKTDQKMRRIVGTRCIASSLGVGVAVATAESQSQGDSLIHLSPADNVSGDPRCRKRQWRLMDGESGLCDTSPAGDPEFRASAVATKKEKEGRLACRVPPSGSQEESARARHWLMMNVSCD
ncbi:hypothetical protein EYF80_020611 [Liparis tanakae]|uniref:Uncharacterized protein n=1 Tax=Liparis tanakae TaxID=230148 RepID=A0A4Z2HVV6_9TELE|nr:hypothetical protein EYF80_020611 [Liparis tanakae]